MDKDGQKMDRRTCNQEEYDKVAATCKSNTQEAEGSDQQMLVNNNGNSKRHFISVGAERITRRDSPDRLPPWGHSAYPCLKIGKTNIN